MSTVRRYTADTNNPEQRFTTEQLNELARVIERDYSNMGNVYWALRQAAETEAKLVRLVDALERIAGNEGELPWSRAACEAIAREALSKFRGEDA